MTSFPRRLHYRPKGGGAMSIEELERELAGAYARLTTSAAMVRHCHEHYLDGLVAAHRELAEQAESAY